jgi:hypothetical protein
MRVAQNIETGGVRKHGISLRLLALGADQVVLNLKNKICYLDQIKHDILNPLLQKV